jgi:hypothetical protein
LFLVGVPVRVCYVDESGDTRWLSSATSEIAPVCVIAGVVFEQAAIPGLTQEFLELKGQRFPGLIRRGHWLERVRAEVKGADLRKTLRTGGARNKRRHTSGFLDKFVDLLTDYQARFFGRVWIKEVGASINERSLYTSSMQATCGYFQHLLNTTDDHGLVICDHRTPALNRPVAHAIFTQKFKTGGDEFDRILEMPTFGDSQNHVGIQIADLLASALLFPMATAEYCVGHVSSVHVDASFKLLARRYGTRLRRLQYRYDDPQGDAAAV